MTVTLPWPPKELSPNFRGHWSKVNKFKQAYKEDCWILTKAAKIKPPEQGKINLWITFYPPNKRTRDLDNMLASIKYGLDGYAAALGVDDSIFNLRIEMSEEVMGMVKVTIEN
jgi:crossover junction endodeoxyribonuclease RusA